MTRSDFREANSHASPEVLALWWKELGEDGECTKTAREKGGLPAGQTLRGISAQRDVKTIIVRCFPEDEPLPRAIEAWGRTILGAQNFPLTVAAERFKEFLKERGVTDQKKHLQNLKRGTRASEALFAAIDKAFPELYTEDSLLLVDGERLRRLADWWYENKLSIGATYMDELFEWKGCAPSHEEPPAFELSVVPVCNEFSYVLHNLKKLMAEKGLDASGVSSFLSKESVVKAVYALLGFKDEELLPSNGIPCDDDGAPLSPVRLSRADLSLMQAEALKRLSPSSVAAATETTPVALELACERVLDRLLERSAMDALVEALDREPVPWEDSMFSVLEEFRAARDHNARCEAFFRLLKYMMRPPENDPVRVNDRGALRDPRFLNGDLLHYWLGCLAPKPETLLRLAPGVLAHLDETERNGDEEKPLAARFFRAALLRAKQPDAQASDRAWDGAMQCMDLALDMLKRFPRLLSRELPEVGARYYEPVPGIYLSGGTDDCVYLARRLMQRAELNLACPTPSDPTDYWKERFREIDALPLLDDAFPREDMDAALEELTESKLPLLRLCRAQSDGQTALDILKRRCAEGFSLRKDLLRCHLLSAEFIRRFAGAETEERLLGDVIDMYVRPCRLALEQAASLLDSKEEARSLLEKRTSCADFFFSKDSPFTARLRYRNEEETSAWQREYRQWLPPEAKTAAPAIRPLRETPLSADDLHPVFSGAFDSKFAGDERNQVSVELAVLQNILSGKVVVLQPNQLVDNRAILRLIRTQPGFCLLCRSNLVTLSMFGDQTHPSAYLRNNLNKSDEGFHFSCEPTLARPEVRQAVLRYLDGEASALEGYAPEVRNVALSFHAMDEIFQVSDNRRMHQNPGIQFPKWKYKRTSLPLKEQLALRLKLLSEEAELTGSLKNKDVLLKMREYALRWNYNDRTHYDQKIHELLQTADEPERLVLRKLERVVTDSYILSNGALSLSTGDIVLSPRAEIDEDVILHSAGESANGSRAGRADYLLRQMRSRSEKGVVTWRDAAEFAAIVREIDLLDNRLSEERQAAVREYYTGLAYTCFQGKDFIATGLSAETTEGCFALQPCDAARQKEPDAVVEVDEHYRME